MDWKLEIVVVPVTSPVEPVTATTGSVQSGEAPSIPRELVSVVKVAPESGTDVAAATTARTPRAVRLTLMGSALVRGSAVRVSR